MTNNENEKRRVPSFYEVPSAIPFIRQWELLIGGVACMPPRDKPVLEFFREAVNEMGDEEKDALDKRLADIAKRHGAMGP